MEEQRSSEKEKTSRERGLLYRWQGYSCTVNPEKVLLPRPVCHAALGISHGVLLTEDGLVYSFGDLYWRHSSRSQALSPVLEGFVGGQRVLRVSAGSFHCAAITDDGVVHAWGENANGQCGVSDLSLVPSPTPVSIVDDETVPPERVWILDVACGAQHTLALSGKHEVWAWGTGCQLGLVTNVFPVQRAQKVEHLSGRYVLQIACGGFHSLALVRSLPPLKSSRQSSETCGQCRQPLYTVIDKDDHVIISNNHYCPLGVELTDEKQGQRSNQGSPALMAKTELSGPDQQVFTGLFEDFCPGQKALDGSCRDDAAKKETFHQEPAPVSVTDSSAALPKNLKRTKTKSSPYPDEQALKDYLRRMSDQSLSENFEAVPTEGSRPPSRQTSLKDRCRVDQHDKPMFPALAPLTIRDVTNLSDVAPVATQSSASSALSSQTGRDALPLGVSACDDSEVKDRAVSCQDSLTGGGGEEACDESQAKNQDSERKCLEANKSASLSDVRIEDTDGLGRRRSLPGLLSKESVSSCLGQTSMQLFQTVAGCFSRLCHLTGQHAISLNSFLQNSRDVKTLTILKKADIFLDTYKEYSVPLGNFLVMGGFQALVKPAQECFGKKLELAQKLLELKEKDASPSDLLLKLLYMPLQHLCDYGRVLLKMTACFDVSSVEYRRLQDGCLQYEVLAHLVSKQRKDAEATHSFWKNFSGKSLESLRKPSRRLVCESGNKDLTLQNSGRFSVNTFILFNDTLVHAQGTIPSKKFFSSHFIYPLATLWIEPVSDENVGLLGLKLTTPEESFIVLASSPLEKGKWLRAINQAVDHVLGLGQNGQVISPSGSQRAEPPVSRTATYTFTKEGRLKEATYNGRWLSGKPHGKGTLKWADGRVYCGTFKHGLEDGFGDYMMPNKTLNKFDRYKGHWKEGKMHGFGTYWYATGEVYEGSFQDHQRHGHGMMSSGRLASPSSSSVFVGHWLNDKKAGYGIYDDITKGEKYMGMWLEDQRQGSGVVVTQFGLYYEGAFSNNRMTGVGLLLCEDDTAFEGEFSEDWLLNGKGVMRMPNGDSFEGIFVGEWGSELKVVGTFLKPSLYETETEVKQSKTPQVGRYAVPAEQKWRAVFEECWSRLGCEFPGQGENDRAWENIAVILTSSRRKQTDSPQMLSRSQCKLLESLEVIPQHRGSVSAQAYDIIRRYLIKACDTPLHPLGWLLETLVTVYRMTYVGVGSNRRLLQQAVEEIQSYLRRIFQLVRFLFPGLPEEGGFIPESSEGAGSDSLSDSSQSDSTQQGWIVSSSSLLLPILLPRLYHPLFTLYSLEREREEELYWDCIVRLNRQPDLSLLTFLGVPQKFWPVSVSILGKEKEQVLPSTKDACFATAVETLQQISTAFIPADKLQVIQLTFEDVTQEVQTMLGQDFLWSMDDLFPVFLYVVVRAQIRNLGSEVSLIDDLMEPALQHGELGLMFTTLKACYYQIQHENTTCF
ncbi:alsin isoform X4 [Electrophorus electricus]|uniref:alsin isoform X4 n=1 Tax=Electrophorus electricus TaxID=8005 RepID=UPI0015CFBEFA|nr:alsin isoform X4 [Electrophorus electricus]